MSRYGSLAALASAAILTAGLTACDGGGGSTAGPTAEEMTAATARAAAIASALEAAKATLAGGGFDDSAHMVAPVVTAAHDGTTVSIEVREGGRPHGGSARSGAFAEEEDGPAAITGWTGARFARDEAGERLVVYTDVGAPEAAAFTPENLNRLAQVSGLSGDALPEGGLLSSLRPTIRSSCRPLSLRQARTALPPMLRRGPGCTSSSPGTGRPNGNRPWPHSLRPTPDAYCQRTVGYQEEAPQGQTGLPLMMVSIGAVTSPAQGVSCCERGR